MRLFVAVDPTAEAVAHLGVALAPLRVAVPQLRWGAPEQWHLTLAFLGEVADQRLPDLSERLARVASRTAPLSLALGGAGTFPRAPTRGRVLWIGVTGDRDGLVQLAARCAAAARRSKVAVTEQEYRPHLTLGRPRRPPLDLAQSVAALSAYAGTVWTADHLHLVRSYLGPTVRHERLASWRFAG